MNNKKFKISIYTFLNIYIHFFQSAYAAKRRIVVIVTSACMTGVAVFAYYAMKGCDPLTNGDIMSSNQVRNLYSFLKKKTFSDYQTYPLRLKINKHCFPSILLVRTICRY